MKAFYGARFSPHMTKTPEGFLICHSVPICRTGVQEYLPQELGIEAEAAIKVYRDEEEVFKPSAVASFEGKPVTDDHPPVEVDASNYASYTRGTVQNVRRGADGDGDKLVCDLVVYDASLIAKIEAGKREISCGYECKYQEEADGYYHQRDIIGNHVAIVTEGRAGHEVSIRDAKAKPRPNKGGKNMAQRNIFQRMFAAFAKDAEPEEIREAARAVDAAEGAKESVGKAPEEGKGGEYTALMDAVKALNDKVDAFVSAKGAAADEAPEEPDAETKALDVIEAELKSEPEPEKDSEPKEESVTIAPEELAADEEPQPQEAPAAQTSDKALALSVVRAMKPFIAAMPDGQRRKAADALSKAVKGVMGARDSQPLPGGYGAFARRKAADALARMGDPRAFGENCRKRNPHYKNKEEK